MEEIIRSQAEIAGASTQVLVNTYNQLTGKQIKKFENRSIAENKVANAILSAAMEAGHLGVPKGTKDLPVLTFAEREAIAATKGVQLQQPGNDGQVQEATITAEEAAGDMTDEEREAEAQANLAEVENPKPATNGDIVEGKPLIPDAPTKKAAGKAEPSTRKKRVFSRVQATGNGKSRPQSDSVRGQVLAFILAAPEKTVTWEQLHARFGDVARGCVMKLKEKEHIVTFED